MSMTEQPKQRSKRLNVRHLVVAWVVVVVVVFGLVAVKMVSNQVGAKAYLKEAKKQLAKGSRSSWSAT